MSTGNKLGRSSTRFVINAYGRHMGTIAPGVTFDTKAREWRFKWSPENEKKSLSSAQQSLETHKKAIKSISGVKNVQRIVCGSCNDFKVIISLSADKFTEWEKSGFAPEKEFLESIKSIPGVSQIETQTYTIDPV